MAEMIVYVTGPVRERRGLLGRKDVDVYLINPQLYVEGDPNPVKNFGVQKYEYAVDKTPPRDQFAEKIKSDAINGLGSGIQVGRLIIPPHMIEVKVEYEEGE